MAGVLFFLDRSLLAIGNVPQSLFVDFVFDGNDFLGGAEINVVFFRKAVEVAGERLLLPRLYVDNNRLAFLHSLRLSLRTLRHVPSLPLFYCNYLCIHANFARDRPVPADVSLDSLSSKRNGGVGQREEFRKDESLIL